MPSEALVPVLEGEVVSDLAIRRAPEVVLDEAQKAASALKRVIDSKDHKVILNGQQYLEFEDWQTLARFYGITAKVVSTEWTEYGEAKGFTAHAVALRSDGMEISAAEASCLTDEEKWRGRAKYEWQDNGNGRERVQIGYDAVPLFQLKSMAQTRACAKVLRNVLAWVVVLAGYKATPAEEMDAVVAAAGTTVSEQSTPATGPLVVSDVTPKPTKNPRVTRYEVRLSDGRKCSTIKDAIGELAAMFAKRGTTVVVETEKTKFGLDLVSIEEVTDIHTEEEPPLPLDGADGTPYLAPESVTRELVTVCREVKRGETVTGWAVKTTGGEYFTNDAALYEAAQTACRLEQPVEVVSEMRTNEKKQPYQWLLKLNT